MLNLTARYFEIEPFFFFLQKYVAVSNRSLMKATDLKTLMEL